MTSTAASQQCIAAPPLPTAVDLLFVGKDAAQRLRMARRQAVICVLGEEGRSPATMWQSLCHLTDHKIVQLPALSMLWRNSNHFSTHMREHKDSQFNKASARFYQEAPLSSYQHPLYRAYNVVTNKQLQADLPRVRSVCIRVNSCFLMCLYASSLLAHLNHNPLTTQNVVFCCAETARTSYLGPNFGVLLKQSRTLEHFSLPQNPRRLQVL